MKDANGLVQDGMMSIIKEAQIRYLIILGYLFFSPK